MNLELLRQVCVTPGAPGFEDKIRDFIIQEVAPLVDAVRVDNLGSVIAIVEGKDTEKNHDGRRPHGRNRLHGPSH
ncbi:hypothetical protein J5W63_05150 [Akkermansia massiliensis]|nr:hypothetical protein [Akkermansia massiliensis]QWP22635.1 hypothetical protein J5W63_05150 [Akkermansia massiliensis]